MRKINKVSIKSISSLRVSEGRYHNNKSGHSKGATYFFMSRAWQILITALEIILSLLVIWFVCYVTLYIAYVGMNVNTLLEYPIYFQIYFSWFVCLFLPVLFLSSMWKRLLHYTKYGFLMIGAICILSGIAILTAHIIMPHEPLSRGITELKISNPFLLLPFTFVPNIGVGCVLRYGHIQRYQNCCHLAALTMSYHESPERFKRLLTILLLHLFAYPAIMIGMSFP